MGYSIEEPEEAEIEEYFELLKNIRDSLQGIDQSLKTIATYNQATYDAKRRGKW